MALIKKTKAEMEQRIRGGMESSIWWSVRAFKNDNMMLAVAELHVASELSSLLLDDRFVEVAQEQCEIAGVNYGKWFRKTWDAYHEALGKQFPGINAMLLDPERV